MNPNQIIKALNEIEEDRKEQNKYPTSYTRNVEITNHNNEEREPRKNNTLYNYEYR